MELTVTIQGDSQVITVLNDMRGRMRDMKPAMKRIGSLIKNEAMGNFADQQDPEGNAWKPLSTVTLGLRRTGRGSGSPKILLDTGVLRNSIQADEATSNSVTVASRLKYSAIHQWGGMAGRGRKVKIPQRKYMGVNAEMREDIMDIIRSHVGAGE